MPTLDTPVSILVVDDDALVRELIAQVLEDEGYRVISAGEHTVALQMVQDQKPTVILLDLSLPGLRAEDLIPAYRRRSHAMASLIVVSGRTSLRQFATQADVDAYIVKPFDLAVLITTVERVIAERKQASFEILPPPDCREYQPQ